MYKVVLTGLTLTALALTGRICRADDPPAEGAARPVPHKKRDLFREDHHHAEPTVPVPAEPAAPVKVKKRDVFREDHHRDHDPAPAHPPAVIRRAPAAPAAGPETAPVREAEPAPAAATLRAIEARPAETRPAATREWLQPNATRSAPLTGDAVPRRRFVVTPGNVASEKTVELKFAQGHLKVRVLGVAEPGAEPSQREAIFTIQRGTELLQLKTVQPVDATTFEITEFTSQGRAGTETAEEFARLIACLQDSADRLETAALPTESAQLLAVIGELRAARAEMRRTVETQISQREQELEKLRGQARELNEALPENAAALLDGPAPRGGARARDIGAWLRTASRKPVMGGGTISAVTEGQGGIILNLVTTTGGFEFEAAPAAAPPEYEVEVAPLRSAPLRGAPAAAPAVDDRMWSILRDLQAELGELRSAVRELRETTERPLIPEPEPEGRLSPVPDEEMPAETEEEGAPSEEAPAEEAPRTEEFEPETSPSELFEPEPANDDEPVVPELKSDGDQPPAAEPKDDLFGEE